MSGQSWAEAQQFRRVSREECVAMRALDAADGYSRSEIAFIFELQASTVARHASGACGHCIGDERGYGEAAAADFRDSVSFWEGESDE